jgi:hypothetical protein
MRQQAFSAQAAELTEDTAEGVLFIGSQSPIYSAPGVVDVSGRYASGAHFYFERKAVPCLGLGNGLDAAYFSLGLDCWVMRIGNECHDAFGDSSHPEFLRVVPAARRNHALRCTGIWSGTPPAASVSGCYRSRRTLEAELVSRYDPASAVHCDLQTLKDAAAAAVADVLTAENGRLVASRERVRLEALAAELTAAVAATNWAPVVSGLDCPVTVRTDADAVVSARAAQSVRDRARATAEAAETARLMAVNATSERDRRRVQAESARARDCLSTEARARVAALASATVSAENALLKSSAASASQQASADCATMGAPWAGDSIVGATEGSTIITGPGCPDPDSRMLAAEDGCLLEMLELEHGALERDLDEAVAADEDASRLEILEIEQAALERDLGSVVHATAGGADVVDSVSADPDSQLPFVQDASQLEMLEIEETALERARDEAEAVRRSKRLPDTGWPRRRR